MYIFGVWHFHQRFGRLFDFGRKLESGIWGEGVENVRVANEGSCSISEAERR